MRIVYGRGGRAGGGGEEEIATLRHLVAICSGMGRLLIGIEGKSDQACLSDLRPRQDIHFGISTSDEHGKDGGGVER